MSKQIQINLTCEDECGLISHLAEKFPIEVVDRLYPSNWDRKTFSRSQDSTQWVIVDLRVAEIIAKSATRISDPDGRNNGMWQIRSCANSCIEWSRDLYGRGVIPGRGRLYLDTTPGKSGRIFQQRWVMMLKRSLRQPVVGFEGIV